ncbi:hypothetical protein NEAUS04_2131 [Nematocida ausubeli]|uniref:Uncharacterized protein n=1 Tax=Nematocida ausubeli (strain ATCC PRA-371 / ERTm2) TaxID=1913371 RepID=A0A086J1D6_NEMA1|nr:uncharacterized protein NESG_01943 [Nematocida ausubeli]KAI5138020.1 hypothetical protein NEAUS07_2216 [Nematocida ausubeli]KAI5146650.1 hypothetical protein NEAUS05_0095 [Nematocida ausubeli]KAI5164337.1 hypothetical protein NEAUS04_2131 [Nematocida ausubeli]KFG25954.1 hypothetical protein NESG_01943 [Nematocida ausubeli]
MIAMHIKEIWPEPPLPKKVQDVPRIPKVIEAFQRTLFQEEVQETERKLSDVISDITSLFTESVQNSVLVKNPRGIEGEVKKIAKLYEEINLIISSKREIEAKERVVHLVKKQIKKKQNLINKLNLNEKTKRKEIAE